MEKDRKEKELLLSWAQRNHLETDIFPKIGKEDQSYFIKAEPREYLKEHQFEGVEEIRENIRKMCENDSRIQEIEKSLIVAAMKNKPSKNEFKKSESVSDKNELPAYIYNF